MNNKRKEAKPSTTNTPQQDKLVHVEADLRNLIKSLNQLGFTNYMRYLQSRKKIIWYNFWAGAAYGFGIVVGMTILVGFFVWVLSQMVDWPLIGQYFMDIKELLENLPTRPKFE